MSWFELIDPSVAAWWVEADAHWGRLATHGPPGFASYAIVWFGHDSDASTMDRVLEIARPRTATPEDVLVAVWTGWGHWRWPSSRLHPLARLLDHPDDDLPMREYGIARSTVRTATDPGVLGVDDHGPAPHAVWPADHAWFVAADVDPDWFTVGGSDELVAAVLADPALTVSPIAYGQEPPDRSDP